MSRDIRMFLFGVWGNGLGNNGLFMHSPMHKSPFFNPLQGTRDTPRGCVGGMEDEFLGGTLQAIGPVARRNPGCVGGV